MKKSLLKLMAAAAFLTLNLSANEGGKMQELIKKNSLEGFKGDSKIFSGNVNVQRLFNDNEWRDFSSALVHFDAGARSAWHTHPKGQTLIVTKGAILTGTETGAVQVAHEGDVISCPPNLRHFHGALPHASAEHIAITGELDGKNVTWLEKVSDKEYEEAVKKAGAAR